MSSNAYSRLQAERLEDVDELIGIRSVIAGAKPGRPKGVASINRALVVLMTAQIEGFVEDIYQEAVLALAPVPALVPLYQLGIRNFRNPTPQNVVTLFKSLGVSDILSPDRALGRLGLSWQRTPPPVAQLVFEELTETRNKIAHGDLINVTFGAVRRYRALVHAIGRCLDRDLGSLVLDQIGRRPW